MLSFATLLNITDNKTVLIDKMNLDVRNLSQILLVSLVFNSIQDGF